MNSLLATVTEINIPAAFVSKLDRKIQDWVNIAQSLGDELNGPNSDSFLNKESSERICEQLGLFDKGLICVFQNNYFLRFANSKYNPS